MTWFILKLLLSSAVERDLKLVISHKSQNPKYNSKSNGWLITLKFVIFFRKTYFKTHFFLLGHLTNDISLTLLYNSVNIYYSYTSLVLNIKLFLLNFFQKILFNYNSVCHCRCPQWHYLLPGRQGLSLAHNSPVRLNLPQESTCHVFPALIFHILYLVWNIFLGSRIKFRPLCFQSKPFGPEPPT